MYNFSEKYFAGMLEVRTFAAVFAVRKGGAERERIDIMGSRDSVCRSFRVAGGGDADESKR